MKEEKDKRTINWHVFFIFINENQSKQANFSNSFPTLDDKSRPKRTASQTTQIDVHANTLLSKQAKWLFIASPSQKRKKRLHRQFPRRSGGLKGKFFERPLMPFVVKGLKRQTEEDKRMLLWRWWASKVQMCLSCLFKA